MKARPEQILSGEDLHRVRELASETGLELLVLFGSRVSGRIHPESDWDFGVRAGHRLSLDELLDINARLDRVFPRAECVDLRTAPPLLGAAVAEGGIPLFEAQPGAFARFQLLAFNLYLDFKPILEENAKRVRKAVAQRVEDL